MIQDNLFDLSEEEVKTSHMIYDGKIIKCLVAPYHSHAQLGKMIKYSKTTYLFPEKEMNLMQVKNFISMVVGNKTLTEEIRIITTSQNIIMDMVDGCVRVLTEDGKVVPSPTKTFMANIHDIRHYLLENKAHQSSEEVKERGKNYINDLIDQVKKGKKEGMEKPAFDSLLSKINQIGEPIIANSLRDMAMDIEIKTPKPIIQKPTKSKEALQKDLKNAIAKEDYEEAAKIKKDIDSL